MITSIAPSAGAPPPPSPSQYPSSGELGQDAFLDLLITQMQYQDPLNPLQDKEFIAQLAQFATLEQMQQMNLTLGLLGQMTATSQALSLVGKQISADGADGETITGRVDAVSFQDGQASLVVGDEQVDPGDITRVEP